MGLYRDIKFFGSRDFSHFNNYNHERYDQNARKATTKGLAGCTP